MPVNSFEDYPMNWKPKLSQVRGPIYIYLAEQLKEDIKNGVLTPGTKLPPQRELADYLDINVSTITRAFKLCEQKGLICSAIGRGTYVASDSAAQEVVMMESPNKEILEMGAILPNPDINEIASNYLRGMTKDPDFYKLLQYGIVDYGEFAIKAACRWLKYSGIHSSQSNIIFTNGSQNAIFAIMASLFKEGDKIATMPVTYPGLKLAAKILGIQLIPIPLCNGKINIQSIEYVYKNHNVKGFYFVPDCNNPTSEIIDLDTRMMIAQFCEKHRTPVMEDAIYTLFHPDPLKPISAFAPNYGIFISSVSKIMSPGLRLAVMHVPQQFQRKIWECVYAMQISSPALMMQLFTRLVLTGKFEEIRRLRIDELVDRNRIFDEMCPMLVTSGNAYSPIRWMTLPDDTNAVEFEQRAEKNNLHIYEASRFVIGNTRIPNAIRLSLISIYTIEKYKKALDILVELTQ